MAASTPRHDSRRCQCCDGIGKVVSVNAVNRDGDHEETDDGYVTGSADWKQVMSRVLECRDCGFVWQHRGGPS